MSDTIVRKPAKKGDHTRWSVTLYHNRCDRQVRQAYNGSFQCDGPCRDQWKPRIMDDFDDDAMACRFHTRIEPDTAEYVIVWVTNDAGTRHTKIVPIAEAAKHERFKL